MKYVKKVLKPVYHWLIRLSKWRRRIGLKYTDFTIISNNCTGGYVYQYYGIPYKTPTEGLYFIAKDFLKLVERPEYYFKHEVSLINPQESTLAKKGKDIHYPVGLIDDVEVYFMHYPDPIEAVNKWHRRASRMNFKKLFFLLTETELSDKEDIVYFSELMKRRPRGGICLVQEDMDLPYVQYVPNVPKDEDNGNASWHPKIIINTLDWKKILNNL